MSRSEFVRFVLFLIAFVVVPVSPARWRYMWREFWREVRLRRSGIEVVCSVGS